MTISANPVNVCPGNYQATITVSDNDNNQDTKVFNISVQPDPVRVSPHTAVYYATKNVSYNNSIPLSISGGKPSYTVSCSPTSGSGCNGLNISCNTSSVNITGTPDAAGTCNFTVTITDSCGQSTTATYSVVIQDVSSGGSGGSGGGSGGGGGGGGSLASCSISPNPAYVNPGSNVRLNVTISNGPTNASFSPTTGTCTTFNNTNGFSCTTATFNTNTPNLSLTLNLSSGNSCNTEICVNRPSYRVWNLTGSRRDFRLPNGTCRTVNNNSEITTTTSRLTPGTRIDAYSSNNGSCSGTTIGYFDYSWVICIDDNGDSLLNFNFDGSVSDR